MKTCLHDKHVQLGAKMVDFAGWDMPIQYKGILHEHEIVRTKVGLFDVSHMGRISIEGPGAESFVDFLSTNTIADKAPLSATYTVLCNDKGHCIDDTIIYREGKERFFLVANAANRDSDLQHLLKQGSSFNVDITPHFEDEGILALQGPNAFPLMHELFPDAASLEPMHFYQEGPLIISRTGYTGSGGFEIYGKCSPIIDMWEAFLGRGKKQGIEPVGLGARDTLRLEMGYALYGNELNLDIAPTETVASWAVKLNAHDFMGKAALLKLKESGKGRHQCGITLKEKGVARKNSAVYYQNQLAGQTTSGTFSPTLKQPIALSMLQLPLNPGDTVEVEVRNRRLKGEVTALPFYKTHS